VHESVAEKFVEECKKAVVELYGTDPKKKSTTTHASSAQKLSSASQAIDQKKVVAGGASDPQARYIDPTIIYPSPGTIHHGG